mmetsp:Transcript_14550/g.36837  ORF Transcript_14550/g.36837 Transcript_14550/m.36837 type:complete len:225 (+) Transcript_14550:214-888(+)
MVLAAVMSWRISSSRRCSMRMMEPSYCLVISIRSTKRLPAHHSKTRSTSCTEKHLTYSSTSMGILHSSFTCPIRLASACNVSIGAFITSVLTLASSESALRSLATRQLIKETICSAVSSASEPVKMSSVMSSSSAVETSHAMRPLSSITLSELVCPSRRKTRFMHLSSSPIAVSLETRSVARHSSSSSASRCLAACAATSSVESASNRWLRRRPSSASALLASL